MKRERLLVGIVLLILLAALAGGVFWYGTLRTPPPQVARQAEAPRVQQGQDSTFAREPPPTQSIEREVLTMPASSSTGEVTSPSLPVPPQTPAVAVIASNRGNAAISSAKQEESPPLPNESVPATKLNTMTIAIAITEYHRLFGVYPSGNNAAISKALAGENPNKMVLLAFKHVGKGGELLDPWGTPYDIQVTEDGRLRVHSAGPNLTWGDADDILQENPLSIGKSSPPDARPR